MNGHADASVRALWTVESAMVVASLVLVATLTRLFDDASFAPPLVLVVLAAHAISTLLRRRQVSMIGTVAILGVAAPLVFALVQYRTSTAFGLPTPASFSRAAHDLTSAFGPFRKLVAPVPVTPGFVLTLAVGLWVVIGFADAACLRADAPVQALVPHTALFLFSSVLARRAGFVVASVAFGGSLAVVGLSVQTLRETRRRWAQGDQTMGRRSRLNVGLAIVGATVAVVATVTPALPGSTAKGLVDLRTMGNGPGARTVDSPLVGLASLLGARSDEEMFTVTATTPHYWRLTSLENFSGESWSSDATYRDIDSGEPLERTIPRTVATRREVHQFRISGLVSSWLPTAFEPEAVESDLPLRYHRESASLFLADENTSSSRQRYTVEARIPDIGFGQLASGMNRFATPPGAEYLAIPDRTRSAIGDLAGAITANADNDYARATALEAYFRDDSSFTYDRSVDFRSAPDPLVAFLEARRGFCQQFAGTYAAMARSIGLSARVAVGFTFGEPDDPLAPKTWTVKGRQAHAWPEVFIAGFGWLAFEPTPGRGNPDAQPYNGRRPEQQLTDDSLGGLATTTTTIARPGVSTPATSAPSPEIDVRGERGAPANASDSGARSWWQGAGFGGGLVGLTIAIACAGRLVVVRRRRRVRHLAAPPVRVARTWARTLRDLRRIGVIPDATETPVEFVDRARRIVGSDRLVELGRIESDRRYSADPSPPADAETAELIGDEVRELVTSGLAVRDKIRVSLDL